MAQASKKFYVEQVNTTVEVTAWFSKYNYGYDADGRRGEWRWSLDKTEYTIPDTKDDGERLTSLEKLECEIKLREQLEKFNDWQIKENE